MSSESENVDIIDDESISEDGILDSDDELFYGATIDQIYARNNKEQKKQTRNSDLGFSSDDDDEFSEDEEDEFGDDENAEGGEVVYDMLGMLDSDNEDEILADDSKLGEGEMLSLDGLMEGMNADGTLKKQLEQMKKAAVPQVPLTQREEAKAEREVAYEKTAGDMSAYNPLVQKNRQRNLKFPLFHPKPVAVTAGSMKQRLEPETKDEQDIMNLVNSAGYSKKKDASSLPSDKKTKKQILDENRMRKRQRALAEKEKKLGKRIKKIKSKDYHRVRNKQDRRLATQTEELLKQDPEMAAQLREEEARQRAYERMSQKHKSKNAWAKKINRLGAEADQNSRQEIADFQKERAKLLKVTHHDDTDEDTDDEGVTAAQRDAIKLYEDLNDEQKEIEGETKGIMGMAFMKRGQLDKVKKQKEEALALMRELERDDYEESEEEDENGWKKPKKTMKSLSSATKEELEAARKKVSGLTDTAHKFDHSIESESEESESDDENPMTRNSTSKNNDDEEDDMNIDVSGALSKLAPKKKRGRQQNQQQNKNNETNNNKRKSNETENSTPAEEPKSKKSKKQDLENKDTQLSQEELMARAFPDANIQEEFDAEKEELMEKGTEKENPLLSGWGAWAGTGAPKISKRKQKRLKEMIERDDKLSRKYNRPLEEPAPEMRKDRLLNHVIINEKRDKKGAQHKVPVIPGRFTSADQYEKVLSTPLGSEWNTSAAVEKLNEPAVQITHGEIIDPMRRGKKINKIGLLQKKRWRKKDIAAGGRKKLFKL
eukprot:TRINITY_DN781907_c0_g1_i1.p1 TRINITY_DN781907_c0_g1~~TRINITY_DN781907_c0_g1_i1.p1  ORF type:complete len:772 (+),score=356.78 TRINITY_DN781907_c0_g1_i1:58-2373(+)